MIAASNVSKQGNHFAKIEKFISKIHSEEKTVHGVKVVGKRGKDMGRDQFLSLLITQLTHQDPLKPIEDKEFISQMAQFSSLEQMTKVNRNIESMVHIMASDNGYALLGREVTGRLQEDGELVRGRVRAVRRDGERTIAETEAGDVDVRYITRVSHSVGESMDRNARKDGIHISPAVSQ